MGFKRHVMGCVGMRRKKIHGGVMKMGRRQ